MSDLKYLQLQPVEPDDQDSSLDDYPHDETIDLTQDVDGFTLATKWQEIVSDLENTSGR